MGAAALGLSCHDPATIGPQAPVRSTCGDSAHQEAPSLTTAPAIEIPESRLTLDLGVTLKRIERELSDRVPTVLDKGNRGIGRAGRLGYVVRRGPFSVTLDGERLLVSTSVTVNAQVCKPLGPFCPTYGSCSPKLLTRVSVPLVVQPDYRLGESEVAITIKRSCSIAGFDATPQIRGTARRQAARVKRDIDAIVNQPPPQASSLWQALQRPLPLLDRSCLRITPRSVAQARPRLEADMLSIQASVSGVLTLEQPCADGPAAAPSPSSPPEPTLVDQVPKGVDLRFGLRRDWGALSAELTQALRGGAGAMDGETGDGLIITSAAARGVLVGGKRRVALTLQVEGCGSQWLIGDLVLEPKTNRGRLRNLESPNAQAPLDGPQKTLASHVEGLAVVTIPWDLRALSTRLKELQREVATLLPPDVELEAELTPAVLEDLLIDGEGLVAVARIRGQLRARLP